MSKIKILDLHEKQVTARYLADVEIDGKVFKIPFTTMNSGDGVITRQYGVKSLGNADRQVIEAVCSAIEAAVDYTPAATEGGEK